jgi:hypothetical protein
MGTMSASDAAPLPRLGEVFFDMRGDSRTMRVSWYADTGVAVFSIWQGDTCTGTFRLPIPELPRMVEALTKGPPGQAGSGSRAGGPARQQADPAAPTTAMGPGGVPAPGSGESAGYPRVAPGGGYPDPSPGPYQDSSAHHGYGAQDGGYGAAAPAGYQDDPPTAGYTGSSPDGYQGPPPGGRHQMPEDGYHQEPGPGGRHDLPPGDYYQGSAPEDQRDLPPGGQARSAAGGYQDAGYQDPPPGSHDGSGSAAPARYQDLPPGGYRDLLPGGYGDVPRGADYHAPDDGYREPPAAAPPGGAGQFAGRQDSYPPTGPLPVGRWHSGAPSGEFPQARPEGGFAPDRFAEDRPPAGQFAPDEFGADEYAPDEYAGDGFAEDGFTDDGFPDDPLAGSYQGEAEQGYLPSPPTDMFPAASLSGGYRGQGGQRAGYEPDPADLDHEGPYPAGPAERGGPPRDSAAHRPGRGGDREREYGHSRGRS